MSAVSIETWTYIPAPREAVWDALLDFDGYAAWNPLVLEAEGRPSLGAMLRLLIAWPDGSRRRGRLSATITELAEHHRLAWVGGVSPILKGRHWFRLFKARGGTMLHHGEELTGLYPWWRRRSLAARFEGGYERMNRALCDYLRDTRG